jgi:hypothetical protein
VLAWQYGHLFIPSLYPIYSLLATPDLDEALNIIAKLGIPYETLPLPDQKELLRNVVERVVLNPEGKIIRVDWIPPFAYLQEVSEKVSCGRSSSENLAENQTSGNAGRSSGVLDCGQYRTRTYNLLDVNETLGQLS